MSEIEISFSAQTRLAIVGPDGNTGLFGAGAVVQLAEHLVRKEISVPGLFYPSIGLTWTNCSTGSN